MSKNTNPKRKNSPKNNSLSVEEVKKYMSILAEDFQHRLSVIGEQYFDIKKTLDLHTEILDEHTRILGGHTKTLDSHTEMIGSLMVDVSVLKTDVSTLKEDMKEVKIELKNKADKKDLIVLDKKVSFLEEKIIN